MTEVPFAIYLFGHGPRRRPRLIEMQHRSIIRAIPWLARRWGADWLVPEVFVDLNFPRHYRSDPLANLRRLIDEVRANQIRHVALNIEGSSFPAEDYSWIPIQLREAGADVCNLAGEVGPQEERLVEIHGEAARGQLRATPSDAAEVIGMFPGLAADVIREFLDAYNLERDTPLGERLLSRVLNLGEQNVYQTVNVPWAWSRATDDVGKRIREAREREQAARRTNERLYRLGPGLLGLLRDEDLLRADSRNDEDLARAEQRLVRELAFDRRVEGKTVSYERTFGELILFADPRAVGSIAFYAYRRVRRNAPKSIRLPYTASFRIPDGWKQSLNEKLERFVRELEPHKITNVARSTIEP